jgi:hypothetical protein
VKLDRVLEQNIVGVEKNDSLPPTSLESNITARALAAICLKDGNDSPPVAGDDLAGVVGRPVIDNNYLDVLIALAQRAVDG